MHAPFSSRKRQYGHFGSPCRFEASGTFGCRRSRGDHVINQQHGFPVQRLPSAERSRKVRPTFGGGKLGLGERGARTNQELGVSDLARPGFGQQLGLIEASLTTARPVDWHRHDKVVSKRQLSVCKSGEALGHRFRERDRTVELKSVDGLTGTPQILENGVTFIELGTGGLFLGLKRREG